VKEQHYERLLGFYPADYRRRRGDEMLATLLDAADAGRGRPPRREVAALVLHGLRARLGAGGGWPAALRVAALVLVCHGVANAWSQTVMFGGTVRVMGDNVPAVAAGMAALLLVARSSYGFGVVLVAVAFWLRSRRWTGHSCGSTRSITTSGSCRSRRC
jgi:hypothetical protein